MTRIRTLSRDLLAKYDRRVPRYTSYPTAPQFAPSVRATDYRAWLGGLDPALPLSLYFHIPCCDSLCWFCGWHTKVVRRYAPIADIGHRLAERPDIPAIALPGMPEGAPGMPGPKPDQLTLYTIEKQLRAFPAL